MSKRTQNIMICIANKKSCLIIIRTINLKYFQPILRKITDGCRYTSYSTCTQLVKIQKQFESVEKYLRG